MREGKMAGGVMLIGLVFLGVIVNAQGEYDPDKSWSMVNYAGAAYCTGLLGNGVDDWDCNACASNPGMQNITTVSDFLTQANGYVGYNSITNEIIVSFSGTDPLNIINWLDDLNDFKVKYPYCNKCKVQKGFYQAWTSVRDEVYGLVHDLRTAYPGALVFLTGHSLGAAIAAHGMLDFVASGNLTTADLGPLYDYGRTRLGNEHFSDYYDSLIPTVWRVTHHRDPVPHYLPELFFYHHTRTEVYYNKDNSVYTVCNGSGEDNHCADQFFFFNVFDHLNYLNFDFTTNYLTCKF